MQPNTSAIISGYLSSIGRKGGRKSRRNLTAEQARNMVRVREAKRAFRKYYFECFWSYDPKLKITLDEVPWVAEQLLKNGTRSIWEVGQRLCQ